MTDKSEIEDVVKWLRSIGDFLHINDAGTGWIREFRPIPQCVKAAELIEKAYLDNNEN